MGRKLKGDAKLPPSGKRQFLLVVTPEQHERLRLAAECEMRPLSHFVAYHALQAAEKVIASHASSQE